MFSLIACRTLLCTPDQSSKGKRQAAWRYWNETIELQLEAKYNRSLSSCLETAAQLWVSYMCGSKFDLEGRTSDASTKARPCLHTVVVDSRHSASPRECCHCMECKSDERNTYRLPCD